MPTRRSNGPRFIKDQDAARIANNCSFGWMACALHRCGRIAAAVAFAGPQTGFADCKPPNKRPCFALAVSTVLLSFAPLPDYTARAQEKARRILVLYPYNNLFPVSVITGEAARKRLIDRSPEPLELYTDFLDLGRFSGEPHERHGRHGILPTSTVTGSPKS